VTKSPARAGLFVCDTYEWKREEFMHFFMGLVFYQIGYEYWFGKTAADKELRRILDLYGFQPSGTE
jgi:hypothetical protein